MPGPDPGDIPDADTPEVKGKPEPRAGDDVDPETGEVIEQQASEPKKIPEPATPEETTPCRECEGSGFLHAGEHGAAQCAACFGTGEVV